MGLATMGAEARKIATVSAVENDDNRRLLAAGLAAAVTCELVASVAILASTRNAYGAAALVRQIVETEYLAWAVTNNPDDAIEWLNSTSDQRRKRWSPAKIRGRADGRFPNTDYRNHCEVGGHPTPQGAIAILDNRDVWVEVALYEAAHHGSNTWHYLIQAFSDLGVLAELELRHRDLDAAIDKWRLTDRLTGLPSV
ncbi:MAG: hypothetical protein JHC70_15605 [Rhodococcus sp.]|nr:hypothetical protein [Rhodococcus sp. (in: high G+C Gram-positive bacteria)]MBJ7323754.1 hypothetical protein [Rhodococcus sp. (in: high G+C Gram-positive bacteria)]